MMPPATRIGSGVVAVCATDGDRLGTNCNCFGRDASNRVDDGVDLPRPHAALA